MDINKRTYCIIDHVIDKWETYTRGKRLISYQKWQKDTGNWTGGKVGSGELIGTNWGISAPTLVKWYNNSGRGYPTIDDMKNLTKEDAIRIYYQYYWVDCKVSMFDRGLQALIFDMFVQHRPSTVARLLQKSANRATKYLTPIDVDGLIGQITRSRLAHASKINVEQLREYICDARAAYYKRISTALGMEKLLSEWIKRANYFRDDIAKNICIMD